MALVQLQPLLKWIAMSRSRFLYGLDRTPDERLSWSPGAGAPTPLQLAGNTAGVLAFLTHLIQHRAMPGQAGGPPPPSSREAAKTAVEAGFARLRSAVEALTEADLEQKVPTPWGELAPIREVLWWLPSGLGYYQGELNYLQLAYGDADPNIPPNWAEES